MKAYVSGTSNLGDFLNGYPVYSGLAKSAGGTMSLIIKKEMRKFKGLKEFLMYQGIFDEVNFDDEVFMYGDIMQLSSWPIREDKSDPNRPIETCRYENWVRDRYPSIQFEVDDNVCLKAPDLDIEIKDTYYVGDRWGVGDIDDRREVNILAHLDKYEFIDYNNDMLTNTYIIKNLKKPFITNLTGVGMLADLCNVPLYCVWKPEDWKPEWRVGDNDVSWDNGKNIDKVFEKHFYLNRKGKLVHAKDLEALLV
jgi:hypothetical protein